MTDQKQNQAQEREEFQKMLDTYSFKVPQEGELIKGKVISASKAEVKLDIDGLITGVVRGPELYEEDEEYANLESGDEVEATVMESDNEHGELELSFRFAGQKKAWDDLHRHFEEKTILKVKISDANKGGLLVKYRQIPGFLPVSQLAPENYPRVNGGDKGKILEKLRSFIAKDFETKVVTLDEREDKIIFSEKEAWNEKQQDVISKYQVGTKVEGTITAVTDFGVFISFGENLEGLIHISELAWQRIDNPANLYKAGDKIKAEVISLDNSKIFLSAKKLMKDPWSDVEKKYKKGQIVEGMILKVNPFGLFVKLDDEIHGLAHVTQVSLAPKEKINEKFKAKSTVNFEIVSIEAKEHRLGLAYSDEIAKKKSTEKTSPKKDSDKGEYKEKTVKKEKSKDVKSKKKEKKPKKQEKTKKTEVKKKAKKIKK